MSSVKQILVDEVHKTLKRNAFDEAREIIEVLETLAQKNGNAETPAPQKKTSKKGRIYPSAWPVLMWIGRHGSAYPRDIADATHTKVGTVSANLCSLRANGYVGQGERGGAYYITVKGKVKADRLIAAEKTGRLTTSP